MLSKTCVCVRAMGRPGRQQGMVSGEKKHPQTKEKHCKKKALDKKKCKKKSAPQKKKRIVKKKMH
jgi:hypothetical protein